MHQRIDQFLFDAKLSLNSSEMQSQELLKGIQDSSSALLQEDKKQEEK